MKWEYLEERDCTRTRLSELGNEGWELVSVVFTVNYDRGFRYYFKRPLLTKES